MTPHTLDTWEDTRRAVLARDGHRCTVARLLGGVCSIDPLHVHHLVPRVEGGSDHPDNLVTVCARHHPRLERLRRAILAERETASSPRCPHFHPTRWGREACERRAALETA